DAEEVLQAHRLETIDGLDHHMMALAAQDAADDQDDLGVCGDAPGVTDGVDALLAHPLGVETLEIDAAGHDVKPVPRGAVAVIDELCQLLADGDDMIAARHHAVVEMLEQVLVAEAFVPAGQERQAAQARGDEGAPGAGPAERVDAVTAPLARQLAQGEGVAQHPDRIGGGDVERYELGAGGVDVGDEASGVRDDNRFVTGAAQDARKLDSAHVGGARFQSRRDDQDAHRMRGAIRRVKTSAGWRGCRQNRHRQSYPRNRRLRRGGATDIKRSLGRSLLRTSLNDRVIEATYKPRGWLRQRSAART